MDNYFKYCPAIMSDGRYFTDWRTSTRHDEFIKYINDIHRDNDYRLMLQQNATLLMNKEWEYLSGLSKCKNNKCVHDYPSVVSPELFKTEIQDYNDSMDRSKKYNKKCEHYNDFRLSNDDFDNNVSSDKK